jgi:glycerophosphoryl diester phosphodiesterase
MRSTCLAGLLVAAALLAGTPAAAFDLQGHRGTRGLAPENTLPGFARALAIGVNTLETDIAISRDGVLLISHDPALNPDITRGPDGAWLAGRGPVIFHTPAAELQRYDVGRLKPGSRYASQFPEQQPVDGARLPTLQALLDLVKRAGSPPPGHDAVRLALETKLSPLAPDDTAAPEPFARALVAAVRDAGLASRVSILSFDWRTLQVVQREAPEITTVYLTARQRWLDNVGSGPASPWTAGFALREHGSVPKMIKAAGGKVWSSHFADLDAAQVKEAQALGLQVLAWTVNEPQHIEAMLDLGVDGIVSDRPDRVRTAMAKRGMALPPPLTVAP